MTRISLHGPMVSNDVQCLCCNPTVNLWVYAGPNLQSFLWSKVMSGSDEVSIRRSRRKAGTHKHTVNVLGELS